MSLIFGYLFSNLLLLVLFLGPSLFLVGAILIIANLAKKDRLSHQWVSIPIGLGIIFATIFLFSVVSDPSGLIRFILVGSLIIAAVLAVLSAIVQGLRQKRYFGHNALIFYCVGSFLIPISSGVGVFASNIMIDKCEDFHLEIGNTIVNSLESYYSDKKEYPDNLSELIPHYIPDDSINTCYSFGLTDSSALQFGGFHYKKCSSGITQLSIPEMGTGHFHIYDLNDKKWSISEGDTLEEWSRVTLCSND
jgi:hypothetical protein